MSDKKKKPPVVRLPFNMPETVMTKDVDSKLEVRDLAEALYEGTPHLRNLAEKLAREHGKADAITFFNMAAVHVQNFWCNIAQQLIDHASKWEENQGSGCVLAAEETVRLMKLPIHPAISGRIDPEAAIRSMTFGEMNPGEKQYTVICQAVGDIPERKFKVSQQCGLMIWGAKMIALPSGEHIYNKEKSGGIAYASQIRAWRDAGILPQNFEWTDYVIHQ